MNIDVFISHHTNSSIHIVEGIVNKLEANGIKCWYAPRDTAGDYAGSIADAIEECRVFLLVLNKAASESPHVLNELNLVTERLSAGDEVDIIPFHTADTDISNKARYYIGRMHWLDAMTPTIYDRIDELVEKVALTLNKKVDLSLSMKKASTEHKITSKVPQVRDVFYGRDTVISEVDSILSSGNRVVFLEGIGGIGKSEIAKQYALKYKSKYENIVFVTYTDDLKKLVCDSTAIEISGVDKGSQSDDEFFESKMQIFRSICNEKTLIIVDNFDVSEDENLQKFLEGTHKVIFTTRNSHSGYPTVKVGPIDDEGILFRIFEDNYGESTTEEDKKWLRKLFALVENHTYMIELIAKQMEASFLCAEEMYELIQKGKLQTDVTESVQGRKEQKTAFEHLSSLFSVSNLNDEEKRILTILSLVGAKGLPVKYFKDWSNISNMDVVSKLIHRSWVRKEAGQRLSLHPLMSEVIKGNLKPTVEKCYDFIEQVAKFANRAWYRPVKENLEVADNFCSILSTFAPFDNAEIIILEPCISFLWQVGHFDESIMYSHMLYESSLKKYGEASMETGFAAKSLGGCYHNSNRKQESVQWYEQGLKSMLLVSGEDNEDLAISYSKVARCYAMDFIKDFEKAKEYFEKSLQMRIRLRDAWARGEKKYIFMTSHKYDLDAAEERIGETYLSMAQMYFNMKEYMNAIKYVNMFGEIVLRVNENNVSSLAYVYYYCGLSRYHLALKEKENKDTHLKEAETNLKKALEINLKMRGEMANDTIVVQEYLADTYAEMGKYGDASNAYMAVVSMLEKLYDPKCERIQKVKEKMKFERG